MQGVGQDVHHAPGDTRAHAPGKGEPHQHQNQQHARRNRRALEVGDFARLLRHGFGGDVVAREAGDAAGHEVQQAHGVPQSAKAEREGKAGGGDAEADDVGQRVELAAHGRRGVTPAGDPPVENVEKESEHDERARGVGLAVGSLGDVRHGEEDRRGATRPVQQREQVREVEVTDHREVPRHGLGVTFPGEAITRLGPLSVVFCGCTAGGTDNRPARQ